MRALLLLLAGLVLALPAAAQQQQQQQQQQPSNACRVACRVAQATPSPDQRQCLTQCMSGQPITREAPGQARPSGAHATSPAATARPATPPPAQQQQGRGAPPLPAAEAAGRAGAATRPGAPPQSYGAFYLGIPPAMSYGVSVGQRDRSQAHRMAESACRGRGGNCSLQTEFNDTCVSVVEGVRRAPSAFFMTSDPRTYVVRAITLGNAGNPADAERMARDACTLRERGALTCRIVHAECGAR
jgi:hypothetical protein